MNKANIFEFEINKCNKWFVWLFIDRNQSHISVLSLKLFINKTEVEINERIESSKWFNCIFHWCCKVLSMLDLCQLNTCCPLDQLHTLAFQIDCRLNNCMQAIRHSNFLHIDFFCLLRRHNLQKFYDQLWSNGRRKVIKIYPFCSICPTRIEWKHRPGNLCEKNKKTVKSF